jgi:septal ring factor EnvC (AmiA/AmiB activator)
LADSSSEASLDLVHQDSDVGDVDGALDEVRRRIAASQKRVADLERELGEAADEEAETAHRLDNERERRATLDKQLDEARKKATMPILDRASPEPGGRPSGHVDEAAGTKIASEETTALISDRDRLSGEVARLTDALAVAQAELSRTAESLRGERDEILSQREQVRADQGEAARIWSDELDEAGHGIETAPVEVEAVERAELESRDDELPNDEVERPTRYERASAKLPSIGEDASEVIGSLEDLRDSIRHR